MPKKPSLEQRVTRLEQLWDNELSAEQQRQKKATLRKEKDEARKRFDRKGQALLGAKAQEVCPQGWEVLDERVWNYWGENNGKTLQDATSRWGNLYEVNLLPGYDWEEGDDGVDGEPELKPCHRYCIIIGKLRPGADAPGYHRCPHCEGQGWLKNKPTPTGEPTWRGNGHATASSDDED